MDGLLGRVLKVMIALFLATVIGFKVHLSRVNQQREAERKAREAARAEFERKAVTCEECQGKGKLETKRMADVQLGGTLIIYKKCAACDGRGKVLPAK